MALDYKKTGERLRMIRDRFTQEVFAKSLGVSTSYVKKTELGGKPSIEYLINIATTYHISLDWLLIGVGAKNSEQPPSIFKSQFAESIMAYNPQPGCSAIAPGEMANGTNDLRTEAPDPDFTYMVTVLSSIVNSGDSDLWTWAKIQFRHAFYPYIEGKINKIRE